VSNPTPKEKQGPVSKQAVVKAMQAAAFAKDWALFRSYFADQVYYRVGNVTEVKGPEGVAAYLRDLPSIGLTITRMDVRGVWETNAVAIAEYTMGGTRADGRAVEYPCVDIYRFEGDKFIDWRVYPLEPTFVKDPGAITLKHSTAAPPGAEGTPTDARRIVNTFQYALRDGDVATARSLLTGDAIVRVSDHAEVKGPQSILEHVQEIFSKRLRPTGAEPLDSWEFDGVMLVEMIVQASRVRDGRAVEYPCVESYRFGEGKIREWRIYPIVTTLLASDS
jgi:ketosteroid isomerase-like protein